MKSLGITKREVLQTKNLSTGQTARTNLSVFDYRPLRPIVSVPLKALPLAGNVFLGKIERKHDVLSVPRSHPVVDVEIAPGHAMRPVPVRFPGQDRKF